MPQAPSRREHHRDAARRQPGERQKLTGAQIAQPRRGMNWITPGLHCRPDQRLYTHIRPWRPMTKC